MNIFSLKVMYFRGQNKKKVSLVFTDSFDYLSPPIIPDNRSSTVITLEKFGLCIIKNINGMRKIDVAY